MSCTHPTVAEINLDAFSSNLREIRKWLGDDSVQIIPILKADAYGHGALEIANRAIRDGIETLGVCSVGEGVALREAGIQAKIIIMGGVFEGQEDELVTNELQPVVFTQDALQRIGRAAWKCNTTIPIHIKVDTGMRRLGFDPEMVCEILQIVSETSGIFIQSLMTHFASAYKQDRVFTDKQIATIEKIQKDLTVQGMTVPWSHLSNSAGLLLFRNANYNAVRPGLILYGATPFDFSLPEFKLFPVMRLVTRIVQIKSVPKGSSVSYGGTYVTARPSKIAVIPIGYADGYSSKMSNNAEVLVRGKRIPQVGTICMDMCMVDVTSISDAVVGDEVVLIGSQGDATITVEEVSKWSGVIPYEVFCMIGKRVRRKFI